jgi:hypothetical protein
VVTSPDQQQSAVPWTRGGTRVVDLLARTWHAVAGVLLWTLHLGVIYVAVRVVCVHDLEGGWLSAPRTVVVVATVVIGAASAAVTWASWRAWRRERGQDAGDQSEATRFIALTSLLINVVMLYAVLLEGVGALFLEGC